MKKIAKESTPDLSRRIPSELSRRAKAAPCDHWTLSNRVPVAVGDEIELMRHRIRIVEILRKEDCYTEVAVDVLGKAEPRKGEIIETLVYANA